MLWAFLYMYLMRGRMNAALHEVHKGIIKRAYSLRVTFNSKGVSP